MLNYRILTSIEDIEEFLISILYSKKTTLAFDTETTGLNWRKDKILGVSLCCKENEAVYIPIYHTGKEENITQLRKYFTPEIEQKILDLLKAVLISPDIKKLAHNYSFDCHMIMHNWSFCPKPVVFDTMLAHHLINENTSHGLENLKKIYLPDLVEYTSRLTESITKAEVSRTGYLTIPLEIIGPYACADVDAVFKLAYKFVEELKK